MFIFIVGSLNCEQINNVNRIDFLRKAAFFTTIRKKLPSMNLQTRFQLTFKATTSFFLRTIVHIWEVKSEKD